MTTFTTIGTEDQPAGRITVTAVDSDDYGLAVELTFTAADGAAVDAYLPPWLAANLGAEIIHAAEAAADNAGGA